MCTLSLLFEKQQVLLYVRVVWVERNGGEVSPLYPIPCPELVRRCDTRGITQHMYQRLAVYATLPPPPLLLQ